MKIIFLIMIGLSLLQAKVVRDVNRSTVVDNSTKLQWQDNIVGEAMNHQDAINHCEDLTLGSFNNWRLPTIIELKTIVKRKNNPAILSEFKNTNSEHYWSFTTYDGNKKYAWNIFFKYGVVDFSTSDTKNYVRCVRNK